MAAETSFSSVLWSNFLKYDFIIFLFAIITGIVLFLTLRSTKKLFDLMNQVVYLPEKDGVDLVGGRIEGVREYDVVLLRRRMTGAYSVFANLIMIFPLLGILGTVLSLLPMVSTMGQSEMQANFFLALTSTLWGLVFAIIYKAVDGFVAGQVEDNENAVQLYLQRAGK